MKNKISKNQNKLTYGGTKYKAKAADTSVVSSGTCDGCAFQCVECPIVDERGGEYCMPSVREDGRTIVWVKKEDKHVGSN